MTEEKQLELRCLKCDKLVSREVEGDTVQTGLSIQVTCQPIASPSKGLTMPSEEDLKKAQERYRRDVEYNNLQLGKWSDGEGNCHVALCLECWIDLARDGNATSVLTGVRAKR